MESLSPAAIKERVGRAAAAEVQPGMTIGAGTGSTAYWFIQALGERVREGFSVVAVPTSAQTSILLNDNQIPVIGLNEVNQLDLVVDGADEIDPQLQMIKGGGGALLQEKMVAVAGKRRLYIADESKLVPQLGPFPLPVEVIPFGYKQVQAIIEKQYGIETRLRHRDGKVFLTDHGNFIIDCSFKLMSDLSAMNIFLNNIPGLVDHGLFLNIADEALIGYTSGEIRHLVRH